MQKISKLKISFSVIFTLFVILASYKIYLYFFEADFSNLNISNINVIEKRFRDKEELRFAVIGNINNSIGIFDRKIVNMLNQNKIDFLISSGNAVYDGGEDKYRFLYRSLRKLSIPYIMAFGENEREDFGARPFYRHFGPFFFSFQADSCLFIFLDSTGETSFQWQQRWLSKQLRQAQSFKHRFIIINRPPFEMSSKNILNKGNYLEDKRFCQFIQNTAIRYNVDAVFSSNYETYLKKDIGGVSYFISGGGGGLLLDNKETSYHYLEVDVTAGSVGFQRVDVTQQINPLIRKLEIIWIYFHSLLYLGMLNFFLIFCLLGLVVIILYNRIDRQKRLYRDFDVDEEQFLRRKLKIIHCTNNYLPFIGGVPISIHRLYRNLKSKGHHIKIIAPSYHENNTDHEEDILRCPPILFYKKFENFPIPNPFSHPFRKTLASYEADIVHIHHPFWLGRVGLRMAEHNNIPIIYTYHTRFEKYAHYAPIPSIVFKNILAHYIIKKFASRCDGVIAPTYSAEEYLRNLGVSAMIQTIPTGIDTAVFNNIDQKRVKILRRSVEADGKKILLSVSRLSPEKNLRFLLEGLKKVWSQSQGGFHCLLVGDGMDRTELENYVKNNDMASYITFTGKIQPEDMPVYYTAADLFVFASTSETQGMVLLEAMAGGCPVVAVRSSGIADVIKNNLNGFKTREDIGEWSEAVTYLVKDEKRLSEMSRYAKRFARDYSEEKIAENVLHFYVKILAAKNYNPELKTQ